MLYTIYCILITFTAKISYYLLLHSDLIKGDKLLIVQSYLLPYL